MDKITKLIEILKFLRGENGCPWDKKQTHQSLLKYLQEEVWELNDNIQQEQYGEPLKEELADILLQVVFHSQLAEEVNNFSFEDVVDYLIQKLIRRHPHVFDRENIAADFDIEKEWDNIKMKEQGKKYHLLERVPNSVSSHYLFEKLKKYIGRPKTISTEELQLLVQKIATEKDKETLKQFLGKLFFNLNLFIDANGLVAEDVYKQFLTKKKEKIIKAEKLKN